MVSKKRRDNAISKKYVERRESVTESEEMEEDSEEAESEEVDFAIDGRVRR